MNTSLLSALCLLGAWAVLADADGVTVQDGDFSFPLESVKKLKDLQELQKPQTENHWQARLAAAARPVAPNLCSHPEFPEDLKPVCKEPNAQEILQRLKAIAQDPNVCEICAYAACAGC